MSFLQFVPYGDKSGAKRGFARAHKDLADQAEDFLTKVNGKWGFYNHDDGTPSRLSFEHIKKDEPPARDHLDANPDVPPAKPAFFPASPFGTGAAAPAPKADAELEAALHQHTEDGADVQAGDAFAKFAHSQLTSSRAPDAPEAPRGPSTSSTLTKIERNRPEANGVKRPSAGTICDTIWLIATELSNGDEKPRTKIAKLSEVVKAAEARGINKFTARTQYARWRVFHGITGRVDS